MFGELGSLTIQPTDDFWKQVNTVVGLVPDGEFPFKVPVQVSISLCQVCGAMIPSAAEDEHRRYHENLPTVR